MNIQTLDILNALKSKPYTTQRVLAEECGYSLGTVNRALKLLAEKEFIDESFSPTQSAELLFGQCRPENAVILAAGFGMRMVPINTETPKGLIEIDGQPLIERLITQLNAAGVKKISVVVGFMKESFEYLIDAYGVELIVNSEYALKNNLHSLKCAAEMLGNTYIVPCDIYFSENPFAQRELYSWYMISDTDSPAGEVRLTRKMELSATPNKTGGNEMVGVCYLLKADAEKIKKKLLKLAADPRFDDAFWEEALYENGKMTVSAKVIEHRKAIEINTYEQLREFDENSKQLRSAAISCAAQALNTDEKSIREIEVLKKGMTNRSFLFAHKGNKYVMRIPGEGTDQLIDRNKEAAVFNAIKGRQLCDDPEFIDAKSGYKITRYINDARCCDPENEQDLRLCMAKLRRFHEMGLSVPHEFDIYENIDFYESLRGDRSIYRDYDATKQNVLRLRPFIEANIKQKTLCHIDSVPDNFLFDPHTEGELSLQLTDWEYSGIQDPHVDIAMFCIYALYSREQIDRLIDIYFENNCEKNIRIKIYCYIATCGLLWSNWCEYKHHLGIEFGEYALRQYRYAKDYYRIAEKELKTSGWWKNE